MGGTFGGRSCSETVKGQDSFLTWLVCLCVLCCVHTQREMLSSSQAIYVLDSHRNSVLPWAIF